MAAEQTIDEVAPFLVPDMLDLPPWKRINDLEAALAAAGIPCRRWFDEDGWSFEVRGEVVARGGAIGLLEQDVRRWLSGQPEL